MKLWKFYLAKFFHPTKTTKLWNDITIRRENFIRGMGMIYGYAREVSSPPSARLTFYIGLRESIKGNLDAATNWELLSRLEKLPR
ncbi:hypothetical protein EPI10_022016 [Gossypium australe]|uniref:Uncharacterized protein n=1 Tax=Gossypium australe TaxID=47621 RepID=A0A5B6WJ13_9ROSI|nr:hypothetical protein EPI10_022016 [Gossypium australe]